MRMVADTSAIVAAIIDTEPRHQDCLRVLTEATRVFVTPQVATEVFYLLTAVGHERAAESFLADIASGFFESVNPDPADYQVAGEVVARYRGVLKRKKPKSGRLDLADAMNVVAAARVETTILATLDQDYRQLQPLGGLRHFSLLPDDCGY